VNGTRVRSFLLGALAVGLIAFGSGGTYSAFLDRTKSPGNGFAAGTVRLTDNDGGAAMFDVSGLRPSDAPRRSCITVTYDGSLDADTRLYAAVSSTGVEQYLNVTVETGTTTSGFGDCGGFTSLSTLYSGSLAAFPKGWASGLAEPGNPWTTGEAHTYRFTVTVQNDPAAQGMAAATTFSWEARNR
jgi:predicted ribosomally synthesized peptide with SipW-like signal peptide